MDLQSERMLHVFMLDYIKKSGMHQTAEIFAREAGVTDSDCGLDVADGFLRDWWGVFWDCYTSKTHAARPNAAQAQALSQTPGQAVVQTQAQAQAQAQAQSPAQAQAQLPYQSQAEIQARAWILANSGMLGIDPYAGTLGQLLGQQYYANNVNMLTEPVLASTLNDDPLGVLPGYMTANFHPGWPIPSIDPRLSTDQVSRQSRRMVNRPESRTRMPNGSDST